MTEIEQLVAERRRILWHFVFCYTVWMTVSIVKEFGLNPSWISLISLSAFAVKGWAFLRLWRLMKRLRDNPSLFPAFNDERVELMRLHAWRTALFLTVALQSVWIGLLAFFPSVVPAIVVAQTSLLVMCIGGIVAFLHYDKEG